MTMTAIAVPANPPKRADAIDRPRIYRYQGEIMTHKVDDVRIREIKELAPPSHMIREFPVSEAAERVTYETRQGIHGILHAADDRLLVIIGPCSIHDPRSALEYARRLAQEKARHAADLLIVMRVYFEKPRTTVGWKGLINDPHLNGSFSINEGLRLARSVLLDINELGVPAGVEYLDMITPQYIADLVSWGAIGARTTESQVHRELASGLSCPVGFKNGTDGNIRIAVDAIKTSRQPHHFLSVTKGGHSAIVSTNGNEDCHVILRGGPTPNYDAASVAAAAKQLASAGLEQRLMIDFSHANSSKDYLRQMEVCTDVAGQIAAGEDRIIGVMAESHLHPGRQDLMPGKPLAYGVSITDPCVGWDDSVKILERLADAVRKRRVAHESEE
jgi:3-deoxy-7-phosphoheptulonate synthase